MTLLFDVALTNGNEGRTKHWGSAANRRKDLAWVVKAACSRPELIRGPVRLTVTRILGKGDRLWDADSVGRGNAKELIDAIVAAGFLEDDAPSVVVACDYRQDATRRSIGPKVEVTIEVIS